MNDSLANLFLAQYSQPKRRVFVSYHHVDQEWVDAFRSTFGQSYDVFTDCSLDKAIDSDNVTYLHRAIREDHIAGTSLTIVICGTDTWRRKWVDWEILSTLNKNHALLGVALPHNRKWQNGREVCIVPNRLHRNVETGYAHFVGWPSDAQVLNQAIQTALFLKNQNSLAKDNSAPKMYRNR